VREFKAAYREEHPLRREDLVEKKGWLRFCFPHSYNSDLLEAMLALAELGVEHKGRPSKWITVSALTVLRHFGRLESRPKQTLQL
jgi:hypothetical protein